MGEEGPQFEGLGVDISNPKGICVCVCLCVLRVCLWGMRDQSLSRSDPRLFVPGVGKDSFEQTADAQRLQALPCYSFCHIRNRNLYIATLYEDDCDHDEHSDIDKN